MFPIDDQLVMLIDRLNNAVNVCHEAPENKDQGYPYATGYSRSAMSDVADELSAIVEQLRENKEWQELSPLKCPYSISTSIATPMQLTSKDGHMVVDFYPVKFHTGQIHNRLMLKVVTFCGKTQSKRYINKKDFQYEFDSRTHGYGYQVTDESMIPQFYNSGMGMAC